MPDYGSTSTVPDAYLTGSAYGRAPALAEPGAAPSPLASAATVGTSAASSYRSGNVGGAYSQLLATNNIASQIANDADARALASSARSFAAAIAANGYASSPALDVMAAEFAQTAADVYQLATNTAEPGVDLAALEADQNDAIARENSADELAATRGAILDSALTNPVSTGLASLGSDILAAPGAAKDALKAGAAGAGAALGGILNLLPLLLLVVAAFVLWRIFGR